MHYPLSEVLRLNVLIYWLTSCDHPSTPMPSDCQLHEVHHRNLLQEVLCWLMVPKEINNWILRGRSYSYQSRHLSDFLSSSPYFSAFATPALNLLPAFGMRIRPRSYACLRCRAEFSWEAIFFRSGFKGSFLRNLDWILDKDRPTRVY
ncbi:hypothetical protein CVT26_000634 [Gymnopilus dilepis]|uniref:Uncharacterized protein n=1 Tax=Gymnopilus dilepis TaxID=231916 RepID=A0A409Y2E8_9AGAR|nr:hypothetical protein CVT26_000634 [Gymnopilus dilepis]